MTRRAGLAILCAALLLFAAIAVLVSSGAWESGRACNRLLDDTPDAARTEPELIQQCIAALPQLTDKEQTVFATRYLTEARSFLHEDALESLANDLPQVPALMIRSVLAWQQAEDNIPGTDERISALMRDAQAANEGIALAYLHGGKARIAANAMDREAAKEEFRRALALAKDNEMSNLTPHFTQELATILGQEGDVVAAEKLVNTSFEMLAANEDSIAAGRACRALGIQRSRLPKMSIEKAERQLSQLDDNDKIAPCIYYSAYLLIKEERAKKQRYGLEAIRLADMNGFSSMSPFILINLGAQAYGAQEYDVAIRYYEDALIAFQTEENFGQISRIYNNIAGIFDELGDQERAIEVYRDALELVREHQPHESLFLATILSNIGEMHEIQGRHELANDWFELARAENAKQVDRRLDGGLNYRHAKAAFGIGEIDRAIAMAEEAIDQILENRDPVEAATALSWLAGRYLEKGDLQAAQVALSRARKIMDPDERGPGYALAASGDSYWRLEYAENMAAALALVGETEEALKYSNAALVLSKDRFESGNVKAVANADALYKLRENEQALLLMRQEAHVAELQLRQSRMQTWLGILAAGLAALLAFFLFRSYKSQRKLAKTKDTFLAEIHHRTKNNLQLLSSLLSLDARRHLSTDAMSDTQQGAANRARTMALVHDHIYKHAGLKTAEVDVRPFLEDLLQLLEESLGRADVELQSDIVSAEVDVDRFTPLGLILCEIVTNTYKHAFGPEGGTIMVALKGKPGTLILTVQDNGKGFDFPTARQKEGSLGLSLLNDLSQQIQGVLTIDSSPEGTTWTLAKERGTFRLNALD